MTTKMNQRMLTKMVTEVNAYDTNKRLGTAKVNVRSQSPGQRYTQHSAAVEEEALAIHTELKTYKY